MEIENFNMPETVTQTNLPFNRNDPTCARQIIERLLPNIEVRRLVMRLFAQSVERSNVKPQAWGITLGPSWIKLNVGSNFLAIEIRNQRVDFSLTPGPDVSKLNPLTKFDTPYLRDVERVSIPESDLSEWLPLLENNIIAFIDRVVGKYDQLRTITRQAHSSGVLRYMEEELEMTLPDPIYPDALPIIQGSPSEASTGLNPARNTILYGPPGTGKTYNTLLRAVRAIDGVRGETLSMAHAKPRWDALRREGRIEFVTFHQSYGYEDFVEGIRPVMTDEAGETPRYEVFEGVLKRIALRALGAMLERKPAAEIPTFDLNAAWDALVVLWESEQDVILPIASGSPQLQYKITSISSSVLRGKNKNKPPTIWEWVASKNQMTRVWEKFAQSHITITGADVESLSGKEGTNAAFIASVYNQLRSLASDPSVNTAQIAVARAAANPQDTAAEYLRRGDEGAFKLNTANPPRYVLVIDEINRGNISKIFGELITLIEDDKRIGGEVALTVTLPHSRETFGIPANLYILGTMNTADKSIALVDVALRRRFEFEELLPKFTDKTCPGLTGTMRAVIVRLNERIVLRKDRDHQIGHAFFRSVASPDDFDRVFEKKIIPLLQEYFYGDWESLRYVLRENESKARFIVPLSGDENETGARNRWQWYRDAGVPLDVLSSLIRNYKIGNNETEEAETALDA